MRRAELLIAMNGREVGQLARATGGELSFRYNPAWLEDPQATPISLSFPLGHTRYSGATVAGFLDNLLPDNEEIRRRIQTRFATDSTQPFDLLSVIGTDCVGAIQLLRNAELPDVRCVRADGLSDAEIAAGLRDYRARPLGMSKDDDAFRISLAGAQEKTALLWHNGSWHRPQGPTPTTHIFKLPIGSAPFGVDLSDSVEIEWLSSRLAAELGLPVARAEISRFEDVKVLVVERFDRRWSDDGSWLIRIPQEDLCQALGVPPALKYQSDGGPGITDIMELLLGALDPFDARKTFFRACVAFWLLAAIDGHAKNFSLQLYPGGRFRLCPLYDIMSVFPLLASGQLAPQKIKLAMAARAKSPHYRWAEITRRHWLTTASACRLPPREAETILEHLHVSVDGAVDRVGQQLPPGFPDHVATPIFDGLRRSAMRVQR